MVVCLITLCSHPCPWTSMSLLPPNPILPQYSTSPSQRHCESLPWSFFLTYPLWVFGLHQDSLLHYNWYTLMSTCHVYHSGSGLRHSKWSFLIPSICLKISTCCFFYLFLVFFLCVCVCLCFKLKDTPLCKCATFLFSIIFQLRDISFYCFEVSGYYK